MENSRGTGGFELMQEEDLVRLSQNGRQDAFAELVRRHGPAMHKSAMSILRDAHAAEDEVQNAWLRAWRHIGGFAGESRFATWMTRIVMNQCLMRLRRNRRSGYVYLDAELPGTDGIAFELPDTAETPEESVGRGEVLELLQREVRRIPPLLRRALELRELQQLPMPEVAGELGISVAATKSRLLRARHELRARLERCCGRMGTAALTA